MGEFAFAPESTTALMFSFSAGVAALVVLFMCGYPHDCGNRSCPHRTSRKEGEDDRRFWRR